MPFFIRKSISTGPVRVNFSKGGIGLSAGVTGARIGFNKHGAYVAGGRHGLYYREKIGKKARSSRAATASGPPQTVEQFVNTGLTYTDTEANSTPETETLIPDKARDPLVQAGFWGGWLVIAAGIFIPSGKIVLAGCALLLITRIAKNSRISIAKRILKQTIDSLENISESEKPEALLQALAEPALIEPERTRRNLLLADAAISLFIDGTTPFNRFDLQSYLRDLALDDSLLDRLKLNAIDELISDCLSDHMLSNEEESHIKKIIEDLGIPPKAQQSLKQELRRYAEARDLLTNLREINCPVILSRDEVCYFTTKGRLLKRKQLGRKQRNGIVYKQVGYETDLEGSIWVTSKHIHITGESTRSIRLAHITSITQDLVENVITISLSNRVNPLYFTALDTVKLSFLLNHLTSEGS